MQKTHKHMDPRPLGLAKAKKGGRARPPGKGDKKATSSKAPGGKPAASKASKAGGGGAGGTGGGAGGAKGSKKKKKRGKKDSEDDDDRAREPEQVDVKSVLSFEDRRSTCRVPPEMDIYNVPRANVPDMYKPWDVEYENYTPLEYTDSTEYLDANGVADEVDLDVRTPDGTRPEPFNSTPMGVNSISSGSPHVRPMGVHRTCGEPDEIKKNTHPEYITALYRDQASSSSSTRTTGRRTGRARARARTSKVRAVKSCTRATLHEWCQGRA